MSRFNEEAATISKLADLIHALPDSRERTAVQKTFNLLLRQLGGRAEFHGIPAPQPVAEG